MNQSGHPYTDLQPIFLIVGGPAVGKSTTSRALAARFPKSVHIPVDDLRSMVVSGLAQPGAVWGQTLVEQLAVARESAVQMALSYRQSGFTVVIDDFWDPNSQLSEYTPLFNQPGVHQVLLLPSQRAAHQRNLDRAGVGTTQQYLDQGIQLTYQSLSTALPELKAQGWLVLDTTEGGVEDTVSRIFERTGVELAS
jgi:predicted kinase